MSIAYVFPFRGSIATEFFEYWMSLCEGNQIPDRQAFNPMAVPKTLPWLSVLRRENGAIVPALTGTSLDQIAQLHKIKSIEDAVDPSMAEICAITFDFLFNEPSVYFCHGHVRIGGAATVSVDQLILPFQQDGELRLFMLNEITGPVPQEFGNGPTVYCSTQEAWLSHLVRSENDDALSTTLVEAHSAVGATLHAGPSVF